MPALIVLTHATAAGAAPPPPAKADGRATAVSQVVTGILSYSRWPAPPQPVRLCVVGDPAYAGELLKGRAGTPALAVQARRAADDGTLAAECDAVYLGGVSEDARRHVLQGIVGRPVVSIVEDDPECAVAAMFCLDVQPDRVHFQINLDSVARSGVRIHPNVLQLSRRRPSQ
ncbi:hypothetical protein CAL13_17040 [Bordetella genomosp. 9]|uniref:DUF4154 domain-containing protein n=1 Tax=Bordetella genomosp. 9 TaxID=1416803 RepID=A0A1W6Z3I6_9BORD|nr:hypothetical protein CAL13_17040 [Bordetella genomosp. 9]ARP91692.1 hypothetical protein CAL14_16515 [Bordetella genomosp. 9]